MLAKLFVFALFGCAMILANPIDDQTSADVKDKLARVVVDVQQAIEIISEQEVEIAKLKEQNTILAQTGKDSLKNIEAWVQKSIEDEKKKLAENLGKWEKEAKTISKKSN